MIQKFTYALFGICVLFFIAGCSSDTPQPTEISVSPQSAFVGSGQSIQLTAMTTGANAGVTWSVNGIPGGNSSVGTIDSQGNFTAPAVMQNTTVTITAAPKIGMLAMGSSASAMISIMAPATITPTNNPQVALLTINPPAPANVSVQFGTDTNFGLTTWMQPASGSAPVSIFVAGMRANTPYHMRAVVQFTGANTVNDSDQIFTTGALPADDLPTLTTTTTAGQTPQSGVELLAMVNIPAPSRVTAFVTDLAGNLLWGFQPPVAGVVTNPIKLLPNGHFLIGADTGGPDGTNGLLEEVDLGGNVIWSMDAAQLNQKLAAATCAGCNITVLGTHHDFAVLPNGHIIVIASLQKVENNLTGITGSITVTGDVLIDLDQNHNPVWVWNEFDHLDVNRHPFMFPDWTHTNSVVYSPDDKALIVSIRHQFWVIKIDYNNGQGTGDILWKLGWQGTLTLMNGTDPIDWQFAQHDANVFSNNSSGTFQLLMFDNGNNRELDNSGHICGTTTPCHSRVPIFQIDEAAQTATLQLVEDLSPTFSFFGGSARQLANGNIEFDECASTVLPAVGASIFEVTHTTPPQTVWQMQITGQFAYRGIRIPSLYPGVQW